MIAETRFADMSSRTAQLSGRPLSFAVAAAFVTAWALSGPIFHFSDTWQLVMNTMSSVITFLMVFLIQNVQARDNQAMQAKLDELIRAINAADDRYIAIERLPDREIERLRTQHHPDSRPPHN
jgi:low affinity Fe/Cu permease